MDIGSAYKYIQDLFRRGLVTIVGSGASSALGLPSMGELSRHLLDVVPKSVLSLSPASQTAWSKVEKKLRGSDGLESALESENLADDLAGLITKEVASLVGLAEATAISAMISRGDVPSFGVLFEHILQNNEIADVITTNYDRLLEVAAALAALRVDTMFYGHTLGRLDQRLSREELLEPVVRSGNATRVSLRTRPHVRLAKPHGSLDWFALDGSFVRTDLALSGARQIVAPGGSKYRLGYDIPFDQQRTRANDAIDRAAAFLIIGYGFNDDHLETHLKARFPKVPVVVTARTLSVNAKQFLAMNKDAIGIEAGVGGTGALLRQGSDQLTAPVEIWKLDRLLKEVLGK